MPRNSAKRATSDRRSKARSDRRACAHRALVRPANLLLWPQLVARRVPTKVAAVVTSRLIENPGHRGDGRDERPRLGLLRLMNAVRGLEVDGVPLRCPLVVLVMAAIVGNAGTNFTQIAAAKRSVPTGAILYEKDWEDGSVESQGWGHQGSDNLGANPINGIVYGLIGPETTRADGGTHSGKFSVPASGYKQGAMMLHNRTVQNGSDEWFGMAFYFPSGWPAALTNSRGEKHSLNLGCPNYYSVNSCTVSVSARPKSLFTLINTGACTNAAGCRWYSATPDGGNYSRCRGFTRRLCGPLYIVRPGHLKLNVWHEIIMHVYYTLERDGVVQFWHRIKGRAPWKLRVSVAGNFPTLQTGNTAFGATVTASNIDGWKSTDQFGLYRWMPETDAATIWADDWCRATSFVSAARCLR
jgi:hypothetical protein